MKSRAPRFLSVLCTAALFAGALTLATAQPTVADGSATIQVLLTNDRVWNLDNGWGDGTGSGTATLTISRGGVQVYPALGDPAVTAPVGGGQFRFALFPGNGAPYEFDVQPGDVVTVADTAGHSATTTVVDLAVTGVDADNRVVAGTAPGGSDVKIDAVQRDTDQFCTKTVSSNGTWSVAFTDCNPDIPFVHPDPPGVQGTSGGAYVFDANANATFVDWTVAPVQPPAQLIVNRPNNVEGWNWAAGGAAHVEVFAFQGAGAPLATTDAPIGADGRFYASFDSSILEPGMWVVATDGTATEDVVVSDLEVWGSDASAGRVYGYAAPSSSVTVKTLDDQGGCWRDVTADGTGYWVADFAQAPAPGDCTVAVPFELVTQEPGVQWGVHGDAFQTDGDGDWTGHALWNPSWIVVSPSMDSVSGVGASFRPDHDVTVTIDDPATLESPDVTTPAHTALGWPFDFRLCTAPDAQVGQGDCTAVGGPIDIEPGFLVTVTDGTTSKSEIVTAVDVTNVDPPASTVSGTAAPDSAVLVTASGPNGYGSRTATANGSGAWTADFSQAQGNDEPLQLGPGMFGFAYQTELTGQIDGDETMSPWGVEVVPATLDVVPDTNLLDGQHVNLSGQHWPTNGTLIVSECVLGYPFGLNTPLPCDPSTTQSYPTGHDGSASGSFTVTRTITTAASGTVDCATVANGCGLLGVVWHSGQEGDVNGGITLDYPDQNQIQFQRTTFEVTPSAGLVEGQLVTISGSGWPANRAMDITECAAQLSLGVDSCDGTTTQHLTTHPDGTVSGKFRVSRSILTRLTGPYDCAVDPTRCGIVAVVWHGTPGDVSQGISLAMPQDHLLAFRTTADRVAPSITIKSPADGVVVAEHKLVKASYSCTDSGGSALASCVGDVANGSSVDTSAVGPHSFTVVARDRAGNLAVRSVHYSVTDRTPPTVTLNLPTSGATYDQDQIVIAAYSCADTGSGISLCNGTAPTGSAIDTSLVGNKTFTITAIDNAGNLTQVSVSYRVVFAWSGFFRPSGTALAEPPSVNPAGTPGTTLSVWFDLGGDRGPTVLRSAKVQGVACATGVLTGKAANASGTVAYDPTAGRYQYRWTTKAAWAGKCQQLQVTLTDGTVHSVNFQL